MDILIFNTEKHTNTIYNSVTICVLFESAEFPLDAINNAYCLLDYCIAFLHNDANSICLLPGTIPY